MRVLSLLLLAACGAGASTASADPEPTAVEAHDQAIWKTFGAPFTVASAAPAAEVLADPAPHAGKTVRLTGELTQVCQKMGCWAVLRDDDGHSVRLTMKDHAFGIDKDATGRTCDAEGVLVEKAVDPEQLEHYRSEGGGDAPEAGKEKAYELVATSVAITRS